MNTLASYAALARRLRLREIRERQGLSRKELAERSGIREGDLYLYEEGAKQPGLVRLVRLSKALGVPIDALFG